MERGWYLRLLMVVSVITLAVYLIYPSYLFYFEASEEERADHDKFCETIPSWMACGKVNLGLDLQGGVHLVMGVLVEKAVEQRTDRMSESLQDGLKEEKLGFVRVERPRDTARIIVTLAPDTDVSAVEEYVRKEYRILQLAEKDGATLIYELSEEDAEYTRTSAVDQAIKTIRNRADKLGVTEPTIAKRGTNSILIQLPGVKDPERAIDIIGRTAQLEFKMVDAEGSAIFEDFDLSKLPAGSERQESTFEGPAGKQIREIYFEVPEQYKEEAIATLTQIIPNDRQIGIGEVGNPAPGAKNKIVRTYLLNARAGITGDYLSDAQVQPNPDMPGDYYVTMTFDPKGARIFADLTEKNVRRHMAIVLDTVVNSAPVIQEKIGGGTARITLGSGGNAQDKFNEARDLSLVLKAGALPAPVEIREKRQVGRTLGQEAVEKGSMAIIVGFGAVVLFMFIYYMGSGVIANIALTLNILLVLAILAMFEATLTLPGMAGILLTIGMAVDANVIIFERIREELAIGKTPRAAIESGYAKAFSTIFDANVTTLIAGIVLMQYGTGPVRGFAVTLIIGILSSMFTALVVTRLIYDFFSNRSRLRTLSI